MEGETGQTYHEFIRIPPLTVTGWIGAVGILRGESVAGRDGEGGDVHPFDVRHRRAELSSEKGPSCRRVAKPVRSDRVSSRSGTRGWDGPVGEDDGGRMLRRGREDGALEPANDRHLFRSRLAETERRGRRLVGSRWSVEVEGSEDEQTAEAEDDECTEPIHLANARRRGQTC